MANKQISILVDEEILRDIDGSAARLGRSRNWVINQRLEQWVKLATGQLGVGGKKIADISDGGGPEFDRREEAEFVTRFGEGGTPDLPGGGKSGPHLLTASDGSTAYCNPWSCKFCEEEKNAAGGRDFNKPRAEKILPAEDGADYFVANRAGKDAAMDRIAGNIAAEMLGNLRASGKRREAKKIEMPKWSEKRLRELADAEPGGLMACSPELLKELKETAKLDGHVAKSLHSAGVELDREILVRWGLAENYKPKTGVATVAPDFDAPMKLEVDLCGFKTYNEVDGEHYICGLEKHGPKVKHGDWIKV